LALQKEGSSGVISVPVAVLRSLKIWRDSGSTISKFNVPGYGSMESFEINCFLTQGIWVKFELTRRPSAIFPRILILWLPQTPHPSPLPKRLCRNQRETTSVATRDRRSGDEALDLPARSRFGEGRAETFHCSASGLQAHEKNPVSKKADYP